MRSDPPRNICATELPLTGACPRVDRKSRQEERATAAPCWTPDRRRFIHFEQFSIKDSPSEKVETHDGSGLLKV